MKVNALYAAQYVLMITCIVTNQSFVFGKSYTIDRVDIRSEVLPDGSLIIDETRTYTFTGSFRWLDYDLSLRHFGLVTDIQLFDGHQTLKQDQKSKQPGTFQVYQDKRKFYTRWYFRAKNETRRFTLRYRVENEDDQCHAVGLAFVVHDVASFLFGVYQAQGRPGGGIGRQPSSQPSWVQHWVSRPSDHYLRGGGTTGLRAV